MYLKIDILVYIGKVAAMLTFKGVSKDGQFG